MNVIDQPPDSVPERPATPSWVRLLVIGGLIAVALIVIVMLIAGGQHGPGLHMPPGGTPAGVTTPAP